MKVLIEYPANESFYDLSESYPNTIRSYELYGRTLTVWLGSVSECSDLFKFKLRGVDYIHEYTVNSRGLLVSAEGDPAVEVIGW